MAGVATEMSGAGRSFDGGSSGKHHESGDESTEWRSLEQVENGTPSTSPPYWDTDEEEDGGLKPSELYGKYTWKIDKFSKINKRELRSNAFEVGGYKWYILIYPQGCDVINHLSLFLCVANHDKLLPGWSHLAQFTIAVVNKDPKKSKYSDTLHRFWKKEHDWGWKKFMDLPKVIGGFINADTLIIKAQVQVIRERTDRPFRCLDFLYRRELVRVYLSNVETICRKYLEQQRSHLGKLIEDKARWSSFNGFWLGMDKSARRRMSQENTESILKLVVKHFFVEKEVTSTLVMDSLYIGMKALEGQYKGKKSMGKYPGAELQVPMIHIQNDTFVLVDDVMLLLERAAMEPLPLKDEKGPQNPQNRTKDGAAGEEFSQDSIDRDEMRLTELGRRTIEIFVLQHIFSNKIEIAYQEAVALKRQQELIEEEAAWLAEIDQKARRGAPDKEKKSKKKQGKQKKNNRRGKDKGRDVNHGKVTERANIEQDSPERNGFSAAETEILLEKTEAVEDVSDASDSIDCEPEIVSLGSGGRDASPINWDDTDSSELHRPIEDRSSDISGVPNGAEEIKLSSVDDSSSTCSSDSVAPLVVNLPPRGNFRSHQKNQKTPSRGGNHRREITSKTSDWVREERIQSFEVVTDEGHSSAPSRSSKSVEIPSQVVSRTLQDGVLNRSERLVPKKENGSGSMHKISGSRDVNVALPSDHTVTLTSIAPVKIEPKVTTIVNPVILKNPSPNGVKQADRENSTNNAAVASLKPELQKFNGPKQADRLNSTTSAPQSKPEALKLPTKSEKPIENPSGHQFLPEKRPVHLVPIVTSSEKPSLPVLSRPLSAPLVAPVTRPVVSMGPAAAPTLGRSASATGSLAPEQPTPIGNPQSHQNAIIGSHVSTVTSPVNASISQINYPASTSGTSVSLPYSPALFPPQSINLVDSNLIHPNYSLGMVNHHQQHNMLQSERSSHNDMQPFESHMRVDNYNPTPVSAGISGRQGQSLFGDESYRRAENYHPTPVSAGISGLIENYNATPVYQSLLGDESYRRATFHPTPVSAGISGLIENYNATPVSAGISGLIENYHATPVSAGISGRQGQSLLGDELYRRVENYHSTPVSAGVSSRQGQSLSRDESYRRVENYHPTPIPAGISGRQGQSLMGDESYRRVENYHPTPVSAGISGRQGQLFLGDESYRRVENYHPIAVSAGTSGLLGDESYRRVVNYHPIAVSAGISGLLGDESYRRVENYHPTPVPPGISSGQGQSLLVDEFPHLGIINDLLNDDNVFEYSDPVNSGYQNFGNGLRPNINSQFRYPGESVDLPSTSLSESERFHLYNGFQNGYRSSRSPYDILTGNMALHASPHQQMNGQDDDLISNQWQMTGPELQYLGVVRNNANNDGYHRNHHTMDYPNLAVGGNGYTMFRPSNGGI